MMNSNSSSEIKINKNELSSILPSSILPIAPNFFPFSSMLNFSNMEEKIIIQHNPEVDNFILDSAPPLFTSQVLQPLESECDKCFASESVGGTLPPPRVIELETYLADPANTVPIGADPDVNSIAELCAAIVAAVGTEDPVSEQDIRDFLEEAIVNLPSGQAQQVIDCLVLAGLITETQQDIVVETTIDSAIDGNDDPVANLSSTTSNDINFTFSGNVTSEDIDDINRGFVCVLDGETIDCTDDTGESFTSSEAFFNLSPGSHIFTVTAFVEVFEGETEVRIYDEAPVTFIWTIVPIVVETTIDSAIDGNDDPVVNLSSTTSNDIEFTFSGHVTPEGTEVDSQGFQCRLDEQPNFVPCNGPTTIDFTGSQLYTDLSPGDHTFTVRAFVVVNEETIFDPTAVTFIWTIVPIVVETTIDSAIDGNDDPVANLSSTTSNDIEFTFSGATNADDEQVTERGFVCVLDGETIDCTDDTGESFTSSEEFLNLPPGVHTFTVSAFVVVNEETIFDPTPVTFIWTIVPIVVETTIDSAIDGNDDPVANLSSTTSN